MKLVITNTYEEMSELAGNILLSYMMSQKKVNLSITGGRTPAKMYEILVPKVKGQDFYKKNVTFYNFDEIPYGNSNKEGYTITDLRNYLFTPAGVPEENIHVLDESNYKNQDALLRERGGLDMILIGIGADGHYCGNLPYTTKLFDETSKVIMEEELRLRVGKNHFNAPEEYPDYYFTMGPRSIMNAKHIVLIANGKEKAEIMKRVFEGPVDENIPASVLPLHPNLTVIVDAEAGSLLSEEIIKKYQ